MGWKALLVQDHSLRQTQAYCRPLSNNEYRKLSGFDSAEKPLSRATFACRFRNWFAQSSPKN